MAAQQILALQTNDTINVSHGHISPETSNDSREIIVPESVDVVEDSLPPAPVLRTSSAATPPTLALALSTRAQDREKDGDGDEDELYSLTPTAKNGHSTGLKVRVDGAVESSHRRLEMGKVDAVVSKTKVTGFKELSAFTSAKSISGREPGKARSTTKQEEKQLLPQGKPATKTGKDIVSEGMSNVKGKLTAAPRTALENLRLRMQAGLMNISTKEEPRHKSLRGNDGDARSHHTDVHNTTRNPSVTVTAAATDVYRSKDEHVASVKNGGRKQQSASQLHTKTKLPFTKIQKQESIMENSARLITSEASGDPSVETKEGLQRLEDGRDQPIEDEASIYDIPTSPGQSSRLSYGNPRSTLVSEENAIKKMPVKQKPRASWVVKPTEVEKQRNKRPQSKRMSVKEKMRLKADGKRNEPNASRALEVVSLIKDKRAAGVECKISDVPNNHSTTDHGKNNQEFIVIDDDQNVTHDASLAGHHTGENYVHPTPRHIVDTLSTRQAKHVTSRPLPFVGHVPQEYDIKSVSDWKDSEPGNSNQASSLMSENLVHGTSRNTARLNDSLNQAPGISKYNLTSPPTGDRLSAATVPKMPMSLASSEKPTTKLSRVSSNSSRSVELPKILSAPVEGNGRPRKRKDRNSEWQTVSDVLSTFRSSGVLRKNNAAAQQGRSKTKLLINNEGTQVLAKDDDGFQYLSDLDGPTLVNTDGLEPESTPAECTMLRTASQIAMPPPQVFNRAVPPKKLSMFRSPEAADEASTSVDMKAPRDLSNTSSDRRRTVDLDQSVGHQSNSSITVDSTKHVCTASPRRSSCIAESRAVRFQSKLARVSSFGTVDVNGSPVPQGMIVKGSNTVLKTFSQEDHSTSQLFDKNNITEEQVPQQDLGIDPPFQKRRSLFMEKLAALTDSTGDMDSVESTKPRERARATNTRFSFPNITQAELRCNPEAKHLELQENRASEILRMAESGFMEILDEAATAAAQKLSSTIKPSSSEGPLKALLELDERPRKRRRLLSDTSNSSSSAGSTSIAKGAMHSIMLWRDSLKPHQIELFDELVNISYRLVACLLEEESVTSDMVENYRRRGLQLIRVMNLSHANQCDKELSEIEALKEGVRNVLLDRRHELEDCIRSVNDAKAQRVRSKMAGNPSDGTIQKLIDEYC